MKACLSGTGRVQYLLLACCLLSLVPLSHCGELFLRAFGFVNVLGSWYYASVSVQNLLLCVYD